MALLARSVLSPSLAVKLSSLGTKLGRERRDRELGETLTELSALPAAHIVRASHEIARAARFGWWQEPSLMDELFGWPPSERKLMATNPNYAWLFLFHPNGRVREAALHSITAPPDSPFFLAALAWRLNDWAEPVRQAAKQCVKRTSSEIPASVAADAALYLLERRFVWGRWRDEADVLDLVFMRDDVLAALARQLGELPTGPLATCLRNALRYPGIDQYLPRLAVAAVQPSVRAVAYKCLISGKATWIAGFEWSWIDKVYGLRRRIPTFETRDLGRDRAATDFVVDGIQDKSAFVRKVVADSMIAVRPQIPDEETLVARLAKDRSSAVRSRADFLLRHPTKT